MSQQKNKGARISEMELVRKAKEGDGDAFQKLHASYKNKIFNYLYRVCGDRHRAEDLTQETFLIAFRKISFQREEGHFRSWLFCIAASQARMTYRKAARRPILVQDSQIGSDEAGEGSSYLESIEDERKRPDRFAQQTELREKIKACIQELAPRYRDLLLLCDVEGLSYREVAEALNMRIGSIGKYLQIARQRFRKKIKLDDYDIKFFITRFLQSRFGQTLLFYGRYQYKISPLVDGELGPSARRQVERHIELCSRAHETLLAVEKTKLVLGLLPFVTVSAAYDTRFQERFQTIVAQRAVPGLFERMGASIAETLDRFRRVFWAPWPVAAGGLATMILVLILSQTVMRDIAGPLQYASQGIVMTRDGQVWVPLKKAHQIKDNVHLQITPKAQADFYLGDLYGIRVQEDSQIVIHTIAREPKMATVKLELLQGSLYAKIGERFGARSFMLQIGDTQVMAHGTVFAAHRERSGAFRVELLDGAITIHHQGLQIPLKSHETLWVDEKGRAQTHTMGMMHIKALLEEFQAFPPKITLKPFAISDLEAELLIPKTAPRVHVTQALLEVKLSGKDGPVVKATLDDLMRYPGSRLEKWHQSESWTQELIHAYAKEDFTPQVLLVLASHFLHEGQYEHAIALLEKIVSLNHAEWSGLAQCQIGLIYEQKLHNPDKARQAYQRVLDEFKDSVDAIDARQTLDALKRQ